MLFEPRILVILLFIIINFLIIFVVKTRTSATTSLIIAHLILVLFLSITITSYQSFKEIVLALVVYLMVILSLISNHNKSYLSSHKHKSIAIFLIFIIPAIIACMASFYLAKSTIPIANLVKEEQASRALKSTINLPGDLPDGDNIVLTNNSKASDNVGVLPKNDYKMIRLKRKLSDNFLLKRSSDVILVISGFIVGLLLLGI
jgi:hypothetical protein